MIDLGLPKQKLFANTPTLEAMCLIICTDGWMDWWINLKMQKRETRAKSCWRPSLFRGRGRFDEQRFQCVHHICKWRPFPWFTAYHIRLIIHSRNLFQQIMKIKFTYLAQQDSIRDTTRGFKSIGISNLLPLNPTAATTCSHYMLPNNRSRERKKNLSVMLWLYLSRI